MFMRFPGATSVRDVMQFSERAKPGIEFSIGNKMLVFAKCQG